ncbi:hypothetical protein [Hyphomicrobium sp. 99]|uniref:hypothetical protein n=1 Tax=Hyphomicrobium sp. 99 TaxID=1163419 RepID=UPI0005F7B36C|nr:hypothetical protein [Hyphomicrobium sp. 99]
MTELEMKLASALLYAKGKLKLYRGAHIGEYIGGVEYAELMRIIDDALDATKKKPAPEAEGIMTQPRRYDPLSREYDDEIPD